MANSTRSLAHFTPALFSLALLGRATLCSAQETSSPAAPNSQSSAAADKASEQRTGARHAPVRSERTWSVLAEVGTNSYNDANLRLAYHVDPRLSVEGAVGASDEGYTAGGRARYNLALSNVTPYLGLGATHVFGSEKQTAATLRSDEDVQLRITPANYLQFSGGIDWITRSNFTFLTTIGVAWRLEPNNVEVLEEGKLTGDQQEAVGRFGDMLFGAIAVGYTF